MHGSILYECTEPYIGVYYATVTVLEMLSLGNGKERPRGSTVD